MADIKVYGAPWCPDCRRSKQFLAEQRIQFDWVDIDLDPEGAAYVRDKNGGKQIIPTIEFADGSILVEPENAELAQKLGLRLQADRHSYDLIVVGGGPTALTAALYGAREGIDTLIIERGALGGQAGVTERIDNYPGFPDGVGGAELMGRFIEQASRYGVEMLSAVGVTAIRREGQYLVVSTDQGDDYTASAVLLAMGSTYRRLKVPGEDDFIGAGVSFCATCDGPFYKGAEEVMVVGGGNSAGEEALFLTQFAEKVRIVQRSESLSASQSVQEKLQNHPQIQIDLRSRVTRLSGDANGRMSSVSVENADTGETVEHSPAGVFVFIGLDPNSSIVQDAVELDDYGFVVTGDDFETSLPGVFAAGDVRRGSTKQLASATGEGVAALLSIRRHLERAGELATHRED